jgi:hypothetical protein
MAIALGLALSAFLAVAAIAKARAPRRSADAMASFGFRTRPSRWAALIGTVVIELILAVGVALGSDRAAYAAAALMLLFAATLLGTVLRQGTGTPCPCLGIQTRISGWTIGRNLVLAAAFAALPSLWAAG